MMYQVYLIGNAVVIWKMKFHNLLCMGELNRVGLFSGCLHRYITREEKI